LKSDGSVIVWGLNGSGECNVPDPNSDFIAIEGGGPWYNLYSSSYSLGLKSNGAIVAWGNNYACDVPEPNECFVAIAGGYFHGLAIQTAKAPRILSASVVNPIPGDDITMEAVISPGSCPIDSVTLYFSVDGSPEQSQAAANQGDSIWVASFGQYPAGTVIAWRLVAVSEDGRMAMWPLSGASLVFTVLGEGSIVAWGDNQYGQCCMPMPNIGFVAIAGGFSLSLGLRSDGTIAAWGLNDNGQCTVPEPNEGFVAIAAGFWHSLGLKSNGTIVAWGSNSDGQCNVPPPNAHFISVAGGWNHSAGLRSDSTIAAWGRNGEGQCDIPEPNEGFIAISAGAYYTLGLKASGEIVAFGYNAFGQCNVPPPDSSFVAIAAGHEHAFALRSNGTLLAWGRCEYTQCEIPEPNEGFVKVAAGGEHSLGLTTGGTIVAWGWDAFGQCSIPLPAESFGAIAAGGDHSLAIYMSTTTTDAEDGSSLNPRVALLHQNYPNPFNPRTTISFYVPLETPVRLVIWDTAGRKVKTLIDGEMRKGNSEVIWDGRNNAGRLVSSGIYFCRLEAGRDVLTRKLVLLR
jgi:alpha-tubulin suppressor-like RCC1 family protein